MVNFNFGLGGAQGDDNSAADPAATTTDPAATPVTDDTTVAEPAVVPAPPVVEPTPLVAEENVSEPDTPAAPATEPATEKTTPEPIVSEKPTDPFAALPTDEVSTTDSAPVAEAEKMPFDPFSTEPTAAPTEKEEIVAAEPALAEPDQNIFSNDNPFGGVAQTPSEPMIESTPEVAEKIDTETVIAPAAEPLFGNTPAAEESVIVEPEAVKQPEAVAEEPAPIAVEPDPVVETPVFEPTEEKTPEQKPIVETAMTAAVGGTMSSDDPLSTLTEIKSEISSFVKARKAAITELEKEIDELEKTHKKEVHGRREKISAERTALKDKQQAYKKMAEELMHLTDSFGNGNGGNKKHGDGQKHEKKSPKKTFHPPQSRVVRPAQKN